MYADGLLVMLISLSLAFVSEGISYLFVYRKEDYKHNVQRVEELSKKLERQEALTVSIDRRRKHDRKIQRSTDDLKAATAAMNGGKFKTNVVISVLFMVLYRFVSMAFYGNIVGKLPFEPYIFLRGMTHRGVPGEDFTDCSFTFIYMLSSVALKATVQKLLGFAPPRSAYDPFKQVDSKDS